MSAPSIDVTGVWRVLWQLCIARRSRHLTPFITTYNKQR